MPPVYDKEDNKPVTRPKLGQMEKGGGSSTANPSSFYKPSSGTSSNTSTGGAAQLKNQENSGSFYTPKTESTGETDSNLVSRIKNIKFTKKKAGLGLGLAGVGTGLFFFFSATGPFQFIHFAQLLQQFHFNSSEDQADVRAFRMIRFIKSGGDARETRVGLIGSRMANRMETKMNNAGFKYIDKGLGTFGGFEVDRNNSNFKGKDTAAIRADLRADGIRTEIDPNNSERIIVPADDSYRQNRLTIQSMMKRVGYWKISSAIQTRTVATKWFGFSRWHPMRKIDTRVNEALAPYYERFKKQFTERNGKDALPVTGIFDPNLEEEKKPIDCAPSCTAEQIEQNKQIEKDNQAIRERNAPKIADADRGTQEIKKIDDEAKAVAAEDQRERPDKTNEFAKSLRGKLAIGGAAGLFSATAVLCTVDDINSQYEGLKQQRIILPLIRIGMEMIAVGNQVMNGEGADLHQLGAYNQFFDDPKTGSWRNAESIKAELGEKPTRELTQEEKEQKQNLEAINKESPFSGVIKAVPDGQNTVNKLCGTTSTIIQVAIAVPLFFITGGTSAIMTAGLQTAVSVALTPLAVYQMASLLAGTAVDPFAEGALFGNYANYGARLAASGFNLSRAGRELSPGESQELSAMTKADLDREFAAKSVTQRLLDPYEPRSALAKLIDAPSPDVSSNIAKISSSVFGFKNLILSIPRLFGSSAQAATPLPYDYGFPEYGFSADEIDNSTVYNPYENAREVASMLNGNPGMIGPLNEKLAKCFGVNLVKNPVWAVSHIDEPPNPYDKTANTYQKECGETSTEWLRLRFFIYDTTTMDALSCYAENDNESCANVGFTPPAASSGGALDCGTVSTIDQNPGELGNAAQYVPYIEQYAPGRFCTDEQIAAAGGTFKTPSNAVPNDGLRMYFANCSDGCPRYQKNSEAELTGGGTWIGPGEYIRIKYRNPPGGGNSIWIPVFGGSSNNNPGGNNPPGGNPTPPGPPGAI